MKSPLVYLLLMRAKNTVKKFFKSPGRIVLALLLVACFAVTIVGGNEASLERGEGRDIRELYAIAYVFYTVMFAMTAGNGFGKGASLFKMADVNLIFTGPFRRQTVLFYGLVQQLGTSLLVGFFLLFQYTTIAQFYEITYLDLVWLLLGYGLSVFSGQLFAMTAYTLTSGSEKARRIWKSVFYGVLIAAAGYALIVLLPDRVHFFANAAQLLSQGPMLALPVSGWLTLGVRGLMTGTLSDVLLSSGGTVFAMGILVELVTRSKREYYEDVLSATEQTHAALTAQKEGRMPTEATARTRVKKRGIGAGAGASALYYKHMLENRRSSYFLLEPTQLIFAVISIVFAFIMQAEGGILAGFLFAAYMQMFSPSMGRMGKELLKPYIYLIPESPVKKLFWALAECLPKLALSSLITYLPVALICGLDVPEAVVCTLAGFSFGVLFMTGYMAIERLFSGLTIKPLVMVIYFVVMIVLAIPAIVVAVLLAESGITAVFGVITGINLVVAALVTVGSRNMLAYAELNMQ